MTSTLTISGWGQPADALQKSLALHDAATLDYSQYPSAEASFAALAPHRHVARVIGWSQGGQLALRAVLAGAIAPKQLVLIAAPYQFLKDEAVPHGMDMFTYQTFRENYAADPLRTAGRFHALVAKGDAKFKAVVEGLHHHPKVADPEHWLPWFDALGKVSLHGVDLRGLPPTLIVHGTEDAIVPMAQATLLAQAMPHAQLEAWDGVAHAPQLHDAARLNAAMAQHWQRTVAA